MSVISKTIRLYQRMPDFNELPLTINGKICRVKKDCFDDHVL